MSDNNLKTRKELEQVWQTKYSSTNEKLCLFVSYSKAIVINIVSHYTGACDPEEGVGVNCPLHLESGERGGQNYVLAATSFSAFFGKITKMLNC